MADFDQQIFNELRSMNETLRRQSGSHGGGEPKAGDERAAARANSRSARERREGSQLIRSTVQALSDETKSFIGNMRNSFADLQRIEATVSAENVAKMKEIREARARQLISGDKATEMMMALGGTVNMVDMSNQEFNQTILESVQTVSDFQRATLGATRAEIEASSAVSEFGRHISRATSRVVGGARSFGASVLSNVPALGRLRTAADVLYAAMMQMYNAADKSRQTGINISESQFTDAALMGMTRGELIDTMATYRQQLEGSGQSTKEFQAMMKASSHEMYDYGMSLKDGGMLAAEASKSYRMVAGEAANLADQATFLDKQQEVYKSLYDSIGMTSEKFMEMTKALDESQEVQTQIFKLDKSKRAGYKNDLLVAQKKFILDGLTLQQAGALVTKLNELSGQDGKSRLKQAAKAQAAFGAVGMGADGERVASLIRTGAKGEGEQAELKGLMERFREATGEMQSSGDIGQEMYADAIMKVAGMEGIMKDVEKAIMQRGQAVEDKVSENTTRLSEQLEFLGVSIFNLTGNDLLMAGEFIKNLANNPMDAATAVGVWAKDGWAGLIAGTADLIANPTEKLAEIAGVLTLVGQDLSEWGDTVANAISGLWDSASGYLEYMGYLIKDSIMLAINKIKMWGDDYVSPNKSLSDFVNASAVQQENITTSIERAAEQADKQQASYNARIATAIERGNKIAEANASVTVDELKKITEATEHTKMAVEVNTQKTIQGDQETKEAIIDQSETSNRGVNASSFRNALAVRG